LNMITQKLVDGNITMQYSINPLNRYHKSINLILTTVLKIGLIILVALIYLGLILIVAAKFKNLGIF